MNEQPWNMLRLLNPRATQRGVSALVAHPRQRLHAPPSLTGGVGAAELPYARATRVRFMSTLKLKWLEYINQHPHAYEPGGEGYNKIKDIVAGLSHSELQVCFVFLLRPRV